MTTLKQRLEIGAAILDRMERRRSELNSPALGSGIEKLIVDRELRELEVDLQPERSAGMVLARLRRRTAQ
ncbi:MAG: hypothetical protein KJZ78_17300 [Bryobacteraceae bacterium]|nr:hypothetical protein [Bryobacteraceae bacterium]